MSEPSVSFSAYMAEKIPVSRWDRFWQLFVLMFLGYFAAGNGDAAIFDHPAESLLFTGGALVLALLISATGYWKNRYGPRFERVYIVFMAIVLLVLLSVIVRHELEKHKRNLLMNSNSTPQASANQILANNQRPRTNN
jgi:prepilin signal peptidase PulO-like enzyme (type II secretory pathway)